MALRLALRSRALNVPGRYKAWYNDIQKRVRTPEDNSHVSALGSLCDYYSQEVTKDEIKAMNNFEVDWKAWSHLITPGLVSKLKDKLDAIQKEDYDTKVLAAAALEETEEMKKYGHFVTWNAMIHMHYLVEQDNLIENLYHAKPFESMDVFEADGMWKYDDAPSRWDIELNWLFCNNDQMMEDTHTAVTFQFQKDFGKVAMQRYYYDWIGRHHILCTVGKLSQIERDT